MSVTFKYSEIVDIKILLLLIKVINSNLFIYYCC
jgi:hypothetical protein